MLQIRLFGKPQVICDGTDITPELGNKGCALLCILFLRGGDYYAREKLAAYLWPDSAVSAAKYNLRYTLWKIKRAPTPARAGGRSSSWTGNTAASTGHTTISAICRPSTRSTRRHSRRTS